MSIEKVTDLLERQKLVEEMVRKQALGKHELVDALVHYQHTEELRALITHSTAMEIASDLGQLPLQDAHLVWNLVASERQDEVLWELGDDLR